MNWTDQYHDLNERASIELKKLVEEKGYDKTKQWQEEDEEGCYSDDRYKLPYTLVGDDDGSYPYYIVKWEDDSFLGYNSEDMDYWLLIDDLNLFTKCKLIDLINES